jgi:hypothetical protein
MSTTNSSRRRTTTYKADTSKGDLRADGGGRRYRRLSSPRASPGRVFAPHGRPASGQTSIEAKATLLSGHTRRSRSATATQRWKVRPTGRHSESSQPSPTESLQVIRRRHRGEDDIEFGGVPGDADGDDRQALEAFQTVSHVPSVGWVPKPRCSEPLRRANSPTQILVLHVYGRTSLKLSPYVLTMAA